MNSIINSLQDTLVARFLRYVQIDTQSDYSSHSYPSTEKQLRLLSLLKKELEGLGLQEVEMDSYGYVIATLPASKGFESEPTIGFIAHVDTSPDLSGKNVCPQRISDYQGQDIPLGTSGYTLSPQEFPSLNQHLGHELITTDGTTLLGADDKAGIAEIMTCVEYLVTHPEITHGRIRIAFTADEEIGRGVDFFDVKRFGADFAYTVDGGALGELEYECFNAAEAKLTANGRNVHPGYAKGKMINALQALHDLHTLLPEQERPERTEGYQGFFHLTEQTGTVDQATAHYIIRDHSREIFEKRKAQLERAVITTNATLGQEVITLEIKDQYYNMREQIAPHMHIVDRAAKAMLKAGVSPLIQPIRGGTDGARLSYMGLPCPNLFAGGLNFHSRYEYISVETMLKAAETLVYIAQR